ncbi:MAG: PKD domain-containing protein [Rhodothermia bacterium]
MVLAGFLAFTIAGCGDDGGLTDNGEGDPTASFTASPTSVAAGDNNQTVVTLDASNSSDPDGDALSFAWVAPSATFVEGTSASSEIAKVTYPGIAPYPVRLTVTDPDGNSDSATFTVGLN